MSLKIRMCSRGVTLPGIAWAFTTFRGGNWHPVTWLSHMLDISVWGSKPAGHHFTNVLLHVANTLLLFLVFSRMTGGCGGAHCWRLFSPCILCTLNRSPGSQNAKTF